MSGEGETAVEFVPGERWTLTGALTMESAGRVLAASGAAALPASGVISLAGVASVDSAGVAVLLAWKRRAADEGRAVRFDDVPPNLAALADLYGVVDLLAPWAERAPARAA